MATGKQLVIPAATATKVADNPSSDSPMLVVVQNSAAGALFFGGSNVSNTVFGFQSAASGTLNVQIAPEDDLWAYSVAGATVGVLTSP